MAQTLYIGGRAVQVDDNASPSDVRRAAGVDRNHFWAVQNPEGSGYQIFEERTRLPMDRNILNLIPLPRYRQGYAYHQKRVLEEVALISHRYPVVVNPKNLKYIAVKEFPLNRHFSQRTTTLLVKLPAGYPEIPPVHFYMEKSLTYDGQCPDHFFSDSGLNELADKGWGKWCLHIDQGWNPSSNILDGDSLLTFLELVKTMLDNPERESV